MGQTYLESCARRTVSFAAGELVVTNGIKTSFATSTSPQSLGAADYNGAAVANAGTNWAKLPRQVTISRSSSAASYTTTDIVLTGKVNGESVTENLTPANANGGDTLASSYVWDLPPAIAIPAQANASGAFTIGVRDIGHMATSEALMGAKLHANGTLNIDFGDGQTDAIPCLADVREHIRIPRILTSSALSSPTTVGLTVYAL